MSGRRTRFSKYSVLQLSYFLDFELTQTKKKFLCYVCSDHQDVARHSLFAVSARALMRTSVPKVLLANNVKIIA